MTRGRFINGTLLDAMNALDLAQKQRIIVLENAVRRATVAWSYYQELTDYVEFEVAMDDLVRVLGEPAPPFEVTEDERAMWTNEVALSRELP